jgi:hypothetical protein
VPAGRVELLAKRPVEPGLQLQFEIIAPDSTREWSSVMAGTGSTVGWTPEMRIQAGQRYTWRVYAIPSSGTLKRAAAASFVGDSLR